MVLHSLVTSVFWSKVSTQSIHDCLLCTWCGFGCYNSVLVVQARWGLFYGGRGVQYGCGVDADLSRTVRKIFSSLWQCFVMQMFYVCVLCDSSTACRLCRFESREFLSFLTSRAPTLVMKGRLYAHCVRNSIIYGSETNGLCLLILG